jgi:tetratricopeptide (TPR) repeat protein
MKFIPAKCPECGGDLQIPDDRDFVKCMYCGVDIQVRDILKISIDAHIPNLLKLGNEALRSGNNKEAFDYFNKVLEADIENYEAWFGKAKAAGLLTTLADIRVQEMITCFENSLKYCPTEKQNNVKIDVSNQLLEIGTLYYQLANSHMKEFINLNNTWGEYLQHCSNVLYILDYSYKLNPDNKDISSAIIDVCKNNLNGYTYYESVFISGSYRNVKRSQAITNEYKSILLDKIKALDPEGWKKEEEIKEITRYNTKVVNRTILITITISGILALIISSTVSNSHSKDFVSDICGFLFIAIIGGLILGAIIGSWRRKKIPNY